MIAKPAALGHDRTTCVPYGDCAVGLADRVDDGTGPRRRRLEKQHVPSPLAGEIGNGRATVRGHRRGNEGCRIKDERDCRGGEPTRRMRIGHKPLLVGSVSWRILPCKYLAVVYLERVLVNLSHGVFFVMPALVAGIHVLLAASQQAR